MMLSVAISHIALGPRTAGPVPHEVFVWQRDWSDAVKRGIDEHRNDFSGFIPLAAEVRFNKGNPEVVRVPLDWEVLRTTGKPIGLALRIGPYSGSFSAAGQAGKPAPHSAPSSVTELLISIPRSLVTTAQSNHVRVSELQLDFDCAESKLDGYRLWVESIKKALPQTRVTITALPSWLDRWSFRALAKASDGYVLQVHSLSVPANVSASPVLCDPTAARKAVETAARIGVPFRAALPTYGYITGFDVNGNFIGLSAEGPDINWPLFSKTRRVMADADELAVLVRDWTSDRPATLQGIIWYRLPVTGDRLNWTWPTLSAVMRGDKPTAKLETRHHSPRPGLVEIELINTGESEIKLSAPVTVQWSKARLIAGDGLGGFTLSRGASEHAQFAQPSASAPFLFPNQSARIGWLRFDQSTEVKVELSRDEKL